MIDITNEDGAGGVLLLEMAAQAKRLIARNQQTRIDAAMWIVTGDATFAHRLMLEHKWTLLRRVAFNANIIFRHEFRPAAFNHVTFVRIVAINAADLAFDDGMVRGQIELSLLIQMTCETCLRRLVRINDSVGRAARLNMETAGTMTRFAPNIFGVIAGCL